MIKESSRKAANGWLHGAKDSPWSVVSKNFAEATVGEVRFIGTEADFERIFGQAELPRLLDSGKATSIEGVSIDNWKASHERGGIGAVFDEVKALSVKHIGFGEFHVVKQGDKVVVKYNKHFLSDVTDPDFPTKYPQTIGNLVKETLNKSIAYPRLLCHDRVFGKISVEDSHATTDIRNGEGIRETQPEDAQGSLPVAHGGSPCRGRSFVR
jgi:hypothetical protein